MWESWRFSTTFRGVARMLKLLSPIDYCQGIRRERGTLLLVLFLVQHEIYADIDVSLKYHDERLTLDVSRAAFGRQQPNPRQSILYTGFLDLGLRRTLPSSACLAVLGGCHGYLSKSAHGRFCSPGAIQVVFMNHLRWGWSQRPHCWTWAVNPYWGSLDL